LNCILANQTGRIEKFHNIVSFGYDVKDTLLRHARVGSDEEDHLARRYVLRAVHTYTSWSFVYENEDLVLIMSQRYYSSAIMGCLHRTMAIPEWKRLKDGENVLLECALGAFDMFVLETGSGDFDDVCYCSGLTEMYTD
jgi:F-box protein 21